MIYIEYHDGPEETDAGRIDWATGWYALCDDCGWLAGPCLTERGAGAQADAHALAMGEVAPDELERQEPSDEPGERPAEPGELCTCGRQAVVVYLGTEWGDTGACLIQDGGSRQGPCPWCGDPRPPRNAHGGRCPRYRLRLDE